MWRGIWPGDPPCERYTAAGWGGISCPLSSQRHTRTHMKRKTEKMREKKATLNAKHINLASQNPGRQELKVPFAHQLTHAKHMESAPHLILTKKKKILLYFKMEHPAVAGSGQGERGNPHGTHLPFSWFPPRHPQPPPGSPSTLAPPAISVLHVQSLWAKVPCLPSVTREDVSGPSAPSLPFSAVFQEHQEPCPFAVPLCAKPFPSTSLHLSFSVPRIFLSQISAWLPRPAIRMRPGHPR